MHTARWWDPFYKMDTTKLPVDYTLLSWQERKLVRDTYVILQGGMCFYCKESFKMSVEVLVVVELSHQLLGSDAPKS